MGNIMGSKKALFCSRARIKRHILKLEDAWMKKHEFLSNRFIFIGSIPLKNHSIPDDFANRMVFERIQTAQYKLTSCTNSLPKCLALIRLLDLKSVVSFKPVLAGTSAVIQVARSDS